MITTAKKRVSSRPRIALKHSGVLSKDALQRPRAHDFTLLPAGGSHGAGQAPRRVLLLRPDPTDPSRDQLLLDRVPVPRDAWSFDERHGTLTWHGAYGGGHLHLDRQRRSGVGNVGDPLRSLAVTVGLTAVFDCDVALGAGATFSDAGATVVGFTWDPTSTAWKGADWISNRLQLTYSEQPSGPLSPPTFSFTFTDNVTGAMPWAPSLFEASLQLGNRAGLMVWDLNFKSQVPPDPDQGSPATGPDSVYPYWMQAVEDASATNIDGVLLIDGDVSSGKLIGLRGVRHNSMLSGYYRLNATAAPFGVFDGKLVVGGKPHAQSQIRDDELTWSGLPAEHQARTGLAASGSLQFQKDGSGAIDRSRGIGIQRLSSSSAIAALAANAQVHPEIAARLDAQANALASGTLSISGLLPLTPYAQDSSTGVWSDVVQTAVTQDLSNIMNSYIPADMWSLVMGGAPQPPLTGQVAAVAATTVAGGPAPAAWYSNLATAVLTSGLASGSDENCKYMNGPRARAWLGTQVGGSKLYYSHTQQLFQYEWQQRFPLTSQYLVDQITNAGAYKSAIQDAVNSSIADIQANVAPDSTQPNLINQLIAQVKTDGDYATSNNLYWAFAYYTYNTTPTILANIALQMAVNTGSTDGMTLSRLFQQNVSMLTALDPSGYFAREYTSTINQFMGSNIVPSMVDFSGPAASFDLVKLYLQQFVANNINSEDADIKKAAQSLQQFVQDQQFDEVLRSSLEILKEISETTADALALPYISFKFLNQFRTDHPNWATAGDVIGSTIVSGITVMGALSVIQDWENFDEMSPEEKAQFILDATQLGLQIVSGVLKGSVRMYAIYAAEGLTKGRLQGMGAVLIKGTSDDLDKAMSQLGNKTAKWIGGTTPKPAATPGEGGGPSINGDGEDESQVISSKTPLPVNQADEGATDWVGKVFGKNLDEFVATRVGSVFIIGGIVFSLWDAFSGDSGVQLAGDIVNAVQGGLTFLALLGEWGVGAGTCLAPVLAAAGPLAIVAAIAGIGFMIYEMLDKPPDPVATFVDQYVKPAGFYVSNTASAIDYATQYADTQGGTTVLMVGFTLGVNGGVLSCSSSGAISVAPASGQPSSVWTASTDGFGQSQISTLIQPSSAQSPARVLLSLMSDGSVSFQPAQGGATSSTGAPSIVTQTWLAVPQQDATLTADGEDLQSIPLTLQPVHPNAQGNLAPGQAQGWLVQSGNGVSVSSSGGTTFILQMSGMAPNFMTMPSISLWVGMTPTPGLSYAPRFGVGPSPGTYSVAPALPSFLELDAVAGTITPTGQAPSAAVNGTYTITMTNSYGAASASFGVQVAALQVPSLLSAAA